MTENKKKISILIADDVRYIREGLASALQQEKLISSVSFAVNGRDAVEQFERCKPDIVIMDIRMPVMNGIEAAKKILALHPKAKIIAFSIHDEWRMVEEMIEAGACCYVLKTSEVSEVEHAISEARSGRHYYSPGITEGMLHKANHQPAAVKRTNIIENLSEREKEILQHIISGHSNKVTSEMCNLSQRTIETHRKNIYEKLKTKSPFGLSICAMELGIVPFPEK